MRLRTKILLLAVLPLLSSLALMAIVVRQQEHDLSRSEFAMVEKAYMQARRSELRNYVVLAASTIDGLYARAGDGAAIRQQALDRLATLNYGPDGYFFVYDLQGRVLMHSRQPDLVGQNLWSLRDPQGRATIQRLIAQARAGGGFVDYLWQQPSTGRMVPKLGYVMAYERWGWMVGTGLYLDGIQATLADLQAQANHNVAATLLWIAAIAALGVALISAGALALNLSEHRVAEGKLRRLAQQVQQSQEQERARLSRELHDGVSQLLVSAKLLVEAAAHTGQHAALAKAIALLNQGLTEVRQLSHQLRPSLLDTLGLPAALQHLGREFEEATGLNVAVHLRGDERELGDPIKIALFRVAQESLTNVAKHAAARQVVVSLAFGPGRLVEMAIADDGAGFDAQAVQQHPERGIGLRNMRERLAAIGGELAVQTRPGRGTRIRIALEA